MPLPSREVTEVAPAQSAAIAQMEKSETLRRVAVGPLIRRAVMMARWMVVRRSGWFNCRARWGVMWWFGGWAVASSIAV